MNLPLAAAEKLGGVELLSFPSPTETLGVVIRDVDSSLAVVHEWLSECQASLFDQGGRRGLQSDCIRRTGSRYQGQAILQVPRNLFQSYL